MYYFIRLTIAALICLCICSCFEREVLRIQKNIKIPLLQQSDTIQIATKPGYSYDISVNMDTIRGPRPLPPPPSPLIKIITQPGYVYDVRIAMDTIRGPRPLPLPQQSRSSVFYPEILISSGQIVNFSSPYPSEEVSINFGPSRPSMDTIHVEVYYPGSGKTIYIPCNEDEIIQVPCDFAPGGVMSVPCGSYIECGDTTETDH
jgi:hypothetical protein